MPRSFGNVDHKLREAEFFLNEIPRAGAGIFKAQCYVSAFASSTRSVTFALQSSLTGIEGFEDWYATKRDELKRAPIAKFFNDFRRVDIHIGDNVVGGGSSGPGHTTLHWFVPSPDLPEVPSVDVASACREYFVLVLKLVLDCYVQFGPVIDAHQRYTQAHFDQIGKTIEDAEEEVGLPRGHTDIGDPRFLPYRWKLIRQSVPGCGVNHLFDQYLDQVAPYPFEDDDLPSWDTITDDTPKSEKEA